MSDPGGGVTYCYRHPKREANVRCTRCDRPICPECMRPASVGFHCPDDAREGSRSIRAPRTSVGARVVESPPWVTITLVVLNVAAYLATGLQRPGTLSDPAGSSLFRSWQLQPYATDRDSAYYRLITSDFLHFSLIHIAANMIMLGILGPVVERVLGWWRFALLYLIGGLGGSALVFAFENEFTNTAGASGAVYALFGAGLVLVRKLGLDLQWLIAVVVLNFAVTFSTSGISQLGHVGGFVAGGLCAFAIGGSPRSSARVATGVQAAGLAGVLALAVVVVAVRAATFS